MGIMKTVACVLPMVAMPVGETSERMRRYGVGKFIPVDRYDQWKLATEEILDQGLPQALDREMARDAYDWPQVARRFIEVYDHLCRQYIGPRVGLHG